MSDLDKKDVDIKKLAANALNDGELFKELMNGILSKDNTIRQNSFKLLQIIVRKIPNFYILTGINSVQCLKAKIITINT